MVMHRKGAAGVPFKLIMVVAIIIGVILFSYFGIGYAKGLFVDAPLPTEEDTAKELCNLACTKANANPKTCEKWRSDFCDKPYIDAQNCSSLVQINVLECESPIDECGCIFEDEFVS